MQRSSTLRRGIWFLIGANGLTASVDGIAKHLSAQLPSVQIVWGYFFSICVMFTLMTIIRGLSVRDIVTTRHLGAQALRSMALGLTITALFVAIACLPFTDAIAVSFASPLFIVVLSAPLLGERVTVLRLSAVLVGFSGALLIIRPSFADWSWVVLAPLASAFFWAVFQILTRRLAIRDTRLTTLFYTAFGGFAWMSLIVWGFWEPITTTQILWFAATGVLGLGAHLMMIRAFEDGEASVLAPFNYSKLLWVGAMAMWVFAEFPTFETCLGAGLIVVSGYVVFRYGTRNVVC